MPAPRRRTHWRYDHAGEAAAINIIEFEETLIAMRNAHYRQRHVEAPGEGFRPVGGSVADFCAAEHEGEHHFFYIERRLQEGTPFYPGHETYLGHASTRDFFDWSVHEPAIWIRPETWEGAHVWAPNILKRGDTYVMAYTGINERISQDIGLAFSSDLFNWTRWEGNPLSPAKDRPWSFWRTDGIASCRDPHLFEQDGRVFMIYTANTREGATCIAMASSANLESWEDHGPILVGAAEGYEPRLQGGHPQGSLESAILLNRRGRWFLSATAAVRGSEIRNWIFESDRFDRFSFSSGREFWRDAIGVEVLKEKGTRSLLAAFSAGVIRLGEVDWAEEAPVARYLETPAEVRAWLKP